MFEILIGALFIIILGGLVLLIFHRRKKPKLTKTNFDLYSHQIFNTQNLDPAHAIIESHKAFVAAIKSMIPDSSNENAAEVIKKVVEQFKNADAIWKFHRLRNQVAHETTVKISYEESHQARQEFIRALKSLL